MSKNSGELMRVVIVGHVDHGKSTLIGRLLYDTGSLPDGKYEELQQICKKRGTDAMEWSFVLDAFQAERDQAVTIDTTQIWFSTDARDYVIIDAPGHREFLKNMVSGAAQADAAILVVDATEGMQEQTRRHAYLLHLLGMKQIAVVINKMDAAGYDQGVFDALAQEATEYLNSIGVEPQYIIPISAREGDMIARRNDVMEWHTGKTLTDILDTFDIKQSPEGQSLRFPVQDVYRHNQKRIIVGRVETGRISAGDQILFSPTNEKAVVTSIEAWPEQDNPPHDAKAGQSIGVTLDQKIFVERGHVGSHIQDPPMLSNMLRVNMFWLGKEPLKVGQSYIIKFATYESKVTVQSIDAIIRTDNLDRAENPSEVLRNDVAEVTFRSRRLMPLDPYTNNDRMGRAVIYDVQDIVGGGMINMDGFADQRRKTKPKSQNIAKVDHALDDMIRADHKGHHGGVFWFTGLSGSGKSTLAMAVEKELFERGHHTYVLDGDNVRYGLNKDLGFSPKDRAENIRRVGEVAALMAGAGLITVTAFISPYREDRNRARRARPENFHEIYIEADLETCEKRDPKGLYKKARAGDIKEFTGIDSPYEAPDNPELVVNTRDHDIDTCVLQIVRYIEEHISLNNNKNKQADGTTGRAAWSI